MGYCYDVSCLYVIAIRSHHIEMKARVLKFGEGETGETFDSTQLIGHEPKSFPFVSHGVAAYGGLVYDPLIRLVRDKTYYITGVTPDNYVAWDYVNKKPISIVFQLIYSPDPDPQIKWSDEVPVYLDMGGK